MSDKKRKNKRSNKELEKVTGGKAPSSSEEGSLGEGLNINPNPFMIKVPSEQDPNVIPAYAHPDLFEKNQPNLDIPPVSDPNGGHTTTNW